MKGRLETLSKWSDAERMLLPTNVILVNVVCVPPKLVVLEIAQRLLQLPLLQPGE